MCKSSDCVSGVNLSEYAIRNVDYQMKELTNSAYNNLSKRKAKKFLASVPEDSSRLIRDRGISTSISSILIKNIEKDFPSLNSLYIYHQLSYDSKSIIDSLLHSSGGNIPTPLTEAYASYLLTYAYAIIVCPTYGRAQKDVMFPLREPRRLLELAILTDKEFDDDVSKKKRIKAITSWGYGMDMDANEEILKSYLARRDSRKITYREAEAACEALDSYNKASLIITLMERSDPPVSVINRLLGKYAFRGDSTEEILVNYASAHNSPTAIKKLITLIEKEKNAVETPKKALDIILGMESQESFLNHAETNTLLSAQDETDVETLKKIVNDVNFGGDNGLYESAAKFFSVLPEQVITRALSHPELFPHVMSHSNVTERIITFANRLDNGGYYTHILSAHGAQKENYVKEAILRNDENSLIAVRNSVISPSRTLELIKGLPSGSHDELLVSFATRVDLEASHVHYLVKNGSEKVIETLRENDYVIITEDMLYARLGNE